MASRVRSRIWLVLTASVLQVGCAITRPPPQTLIDRPDPAIETSYVGIGARVSLKELEQYLNKSVPFQYSRSGDDRWKECKYEWSVKASRSPFVIKAIENGIAVTATYKVGGRFRNRYRPLCPVPPFRESTDPDGVATITITLRPVVDDLYVVNPQIAVQNWNWSVRPAIDVHGIKVTFGTIAHDAIDDALKDSAKKANSDVRRDLDFRAQVEKLWEHAHSSHPLGSTKELWLSLKPLSLHRSPMITDSEFARIYIGLRSYNQLVLGDRPVDEDVVALPILKDGALPSGFAMTAITRTDYDALAGLARQQLAGRTEIFDGGKLTFRDFRAYQSDDLLVLGAKVSVSTRFGINARGWLFIHGRPMIQGNVIRLDKLSYTANTNNPIVNAIAWLFQDATKAELAKRLQLDLSETTSHIRDSLSQIGGTPVGEAGSLHVVITDVGLDTPVPDATELVTPVSVTGSAEIHYQPFAN